MLSRGIVNFNLISFCCTILFACESPTTLPKLPYQLDHPSITVALPKKLREISGLAYHGQNRLICIEDETGTIYQYDLTKKFITGKISFKKFGDFEGIEVVDSFIYVLNSNGTIYKVFNHFETHENGPKALKISTGLDENSDFEGLGYNRISNSLLVASKGLSKQKKFAGKQLIYKFNLLREVLNETPVYQIDVKQVLTYKDINATQKAYEKFQLFTGNNVTFRPSGIAVHPITGQIYLLSSVGKTLVVINQIGELIHVAQLNPSIFKQPEGITFGIDGKMYISNEGQNTLSNILEFDYQANQN